MNDEDVCAAETPRRNIIYDEESIAADLARWSKQSIYRIPVSIAELKKGKRVYEPQMVSIGPYHHGVEKLKAMEKHKHRACCKFLKRSNISLSYLNDVLRPDVQVLRDAYDQLDEMWENDDVFLDLMIMDGCFILELLRTTGKASSDGYSHNDPIFSKQGNLKTLPYLKRDMLMLENQIPMVLLAKLYSINEFNKEGGLIKCIVELFSLGAKPSEDNDELRKSPHILDLYRLHLIRSKRKNEGPSKVHGNGDEIIRSATELDEAGISIRNSESKCLEEISFKPVLGGWYGGVLKLPLIVVDDAFESAYLNLIAYERLHVEAGNEVTSYAFFMDNIIDSVQDVRLLHSSGVIQNALGSDEAVATLFNSLSMDSSLDPDSSLGKVHKQVNVYCQKRRHRWRAYCMHNYFTNPWVSITVVAAVLIFAITILQTVFTVLPYVKPRSPGS